MSPDRWEAVVVGGGIVGLATARALQRRGVERLLVVEAEDEVGVHQTGHNSGVIHSGLFYRPGSLRARTCVAGRRALYRFTREEGVPHRRTGKLVVATSAEQLARLEELERRGRANGLESLERWDRSKLRARCPDLSGVGAIEVGETGIVDFRLVARALARKVDAAGGAVATGCRVERVVRDGADLVVATRNGEVRARHLVGCAGLQADRLARSCGVETGGVRILPFRGDYFRVREPPEPLEELPVYPVPGPDLPFLGVHFTPDLSGTVEAGPTAVLALSREGYSAGEISARDLLETLRFAGSWRLAARHWRAGLTEAATSASKRLFVSRARTLWPGIAASRLAHGRSGIRAQLVDREGRLVDDFRIVGDGRTLHVLNAPSPAATAALAVGAEVADRAVEAWDLG